MTIQPYLFFDGRCEEALEFYKKALNAKVEMIMHNSESPDKSQMRPGTENKILHAAFHVGDSRILASDGDNTGKPVFQGFRLAITTKDVPESEQFFKALTDGGKVDLPLAATFFSPSFGMLTDKFGVRWMIMTEKK